MIPTLTVSLSECVTHLPRSRRGREPSFAQVNFCFIPLFFLLSSITVTKTGIDVLARTIPAPLLVVQAQGDVEIALRTDFFP